MLNFIILYFSNLVLDYPLQGSFLAEWKQKNNYILFVHCAIRGLGLSIVLIPLGLFAWWKVIMLVAGHFVIDYWKRFVSHAYVFDNGSTDNTKDLLSKYDWISVIDYSHLTGNKLDDELNMDIKN